MANLKMLIYDIIMALYVIIAIMAFIPPLLFKIDPLNVQYIYLCDYIHVFFSNFCHQLPWRSIFIEGIKMPVCARCVAIYVATGLGLIFFRIKGFGTKEFKMNWILFAILFLPTGIDGVTQMIGLRESTNDLRLLSGFSYGLGYALAIAWALPLVYALLELIKGILLKKDNDTINGIVKRIKGMFWPIF
jgi:uncharacterized membrane protein